MWKGAVGSRCEVSNADVEHPTTYSPTVSVVLRPKSPAPRTGSLVDLPKRKDVSLQSEETSI